MLRPQDNPSQSGGLEGWNHLSPLKVRCVKNILWKCFWNEYIRTWSVLTWAVEGYSHIQKVSLFYWTWALNLFILLFTSRPPIWLLPKNFVRIYFFPYVFRLWYGSWCKLCNYIGCQLKRLESFLIPLPYIYVLILRRILCAALDSVWKLCTERTVKSERHTPVRLHTLSTHDICDYGIDLVFIYWRNCDIIIVVVILIAKHVIITL
jgi:hypothetical protein